MSDRSLLGAADVSDAALASMVGESLGVEDPELLDGGVEVAEYDLEALTTAGRYWVRGTARHARGTSPYAFFVKVVQSWTRTPQFQFVPEEFRDLADAGLPWRTEPLVYRSDLRARLPEGLSMPRAHAVVDVDELSAAVWLDAIDVDPTQWRPATFRRAAHLLGRLSASPTVRPIARLGSRGIVRAYADGRVEHQVLPALRGDDLWRHPLIRGAFGPELRARLLAAADALPDMLDELDRAPVGAAHGDACPRNLLVTHGAPDGFVLIDFGFWSEAPLGLDLTQLLLGEVQLGERSAGELGELEDLCLSAYVDGLRAEGCDVPLAVVRRAHALLMTIFWGLSAPPLEVLFGGQAPGAAAVHERARAVAFVLDLLESTGTHR